MTEPTPQPEPTTTPPTRGNLLMRFCFGAMLAVAALWLPVDRLKWSVRTAADGVFEDAIVFDETETNGTPIEAGDGDAAKPGERRVVRCRYAGDEHELSFIDQSGLRPGDAVPVAYLPSEPKRAVRAQPDASAFGLYFATETWIVDAALWPIGLVLAIAALSNLVALARRQD
jgi:hypothetical protein